MEAIGLIGIGLLGSALAERFLQAGFAVIGHDRSPERQSALLECGGEAVASSIEVVRRCRRIVLCLPDSDVVETVLAEVASVLRPGQVLLDTTTGDPERMEAIGSQLTIRGIAYIDSCVLGSSAEARAGTVIVLAGGATQQLDDQADLLRCFARQWFHVGDCGAGARMKLVVNLVLGLHRAVLAEGLAFARACQLDEAMVLEVLRAGAAYSRVMDTKGAKMLQRDFRPQARLAQHLKDVRLIVEQASRHDASVPLSVVHRQLLEQVVAQGKGDEDNSAILRAYIDRTRSPMK